MNAYTMGRFLLLVLVATVATAAAQDFGALKVEKVAGDFKFTEGPVWSRDGYLLFTDIPANAIYKWTSAAAGSGAGEAGAPVALLGSLAMFRQPSGNANGLTYDRKGRLIACEHSNRRVSRTGKDGSIEVLAENYEGKRLNSPNDAVVRRDGTVYFTDPPYGVPKDQKRELDYQGVFRIAPDGKLHQVANDFDRPNGTALSPDERTLYVADTAKSHVRAFAVGPDGSVTGGQVVAELKGEKGGFPDGMKVDVRGNLYVTGLGGVWVFDRTGRHLGTIPVPETPANCAFGDRDYKTLYITARTSLYRVRVPHAGYKTY